MLNQNTTKTYFGAQYKLGEITTQRTCILFTGQGTNYPGMFQSYLHTSEFTHYFEILDTFSKQMGLGKASEYIELKKDAKPIIQNLCLFTAQVALGEMIKKTINVDQITAHSFGEYAGLVSSGILSFSEALKLVYVRETFCPEPQSTGSLFALKCSLKKIETLHLPSHEVAIVNGPKQTVIGVKKQDIKNIKESIKKSGVDYVQLHLPQPYHTSLLDDVHKKIHKYLSNNPPTINETKVDFISSVQDPILQHTIPTLEIDHQVHKAMNFTKQIKSLTCGHIIEVGSKDFISPIVQSINPSLTLTSFRRLLDTKKNTTSSTSLGNKINAIIARITGYEIESISVEDRFEEDLGIDSIKKADIVFQILEESQTQREVNLSEIKTLKDIISLIESGEDVQKTNTSWSLYHIGTQQQAQNLPLQVSRPTFVLTSWPSVLSTSSKKLHNKHIIITFENEEYTSQHVIAFCQFLQDATPLSITLQTQKSGPLTKGLLALLKSLQKENLVTQVRLIESNSKQISLTGDELHQASYCVQKTKDKRIVPSLSSPNNITLQKKRKYTILAIGGAKGIAKDILNRLDDEYELDLDIVGRTANNSYEAKANMTYYQHDATLDTWPKKIQEKRYDFVIHAAGYQVSVNNKDKRTQDMQKELDTKIKVAQNMYKLTSNHFVIFSSITGVFGNPGQLTYAFANQYIQHMSPKNTSSICWPPWKQSGMVDERTAKAFQYQGISLLTLEEAYPLFLKAVTRPGDYLVAKSIDIVKYQNPRQTRDCTITLQDLKGHKIQGKYIIPAALCLQKLNETITQDFGFSPLLTKFELFAPKSIEQDTILQVSRVGKDDYILYRLSLGNVVLAKVQTQGIHVPKKNRAYKPVKFKSFSYKDSGLFNADQYQTLDKIHTTKKVANAQVSLNQNLSTTLLVDSTFQLMGIAAKKASLPHSISQITLNKIGHQSNMFIQLENMNIDEDGITSDAYFYDQNKNLVGKCTSVRMKYYDISKTP